MEQNSEAAVIRAILFQGVDGGWTYFFIPGQFMTPRNGKGSLANFVVVGPWARADALRPECKTESSEILPVGLEWSQVISTLISSPTPPPGNSHIGSE